MKRPLPILAAALLAAGSSLPLLATVGSSDVVEPPPARYAPLGDEAPRAESSPARVPGLLRAPKAGTNLLANGGFEQNDGVGTFDSWRTFDRQGQSDFDKGPSSGTFFAQSGSQLFGIDVPAPTQGSFSAMTIQDGPGLHVLLQNVDLPVNAESIQFSCDVYVDTVAESFVVPNPLSFDFGAITDQPPRNQQARIDILRFTGTADTAGSQILRTVFATTPNDPTMFGYVTVTADLTDLAGLSVRVRLLEVDNLGTFIFGVDNCALNVVLQETPDQPVFGKETQIVPGTVEPMVPTVQNNPDGTKAVFWMQNGGSGTIICVQIIDEDDQAVTTPLIVNSGGVINEKPAVDVGPDGEYRIIWTRRDGTAIRGPDGRLAFAAGAGSSIVSRGFNADGTSAGSQTVLSNGGANDSNDASASTDKNGETTVTWEDGGVVKGRVLKKNGSPKTGIFNITGTLGSGASKPKVATSASGDVIAVWRQTSGITTGIIALVLDASGNPATSFLQVESAINARAPDVAADEFGNFIVVWEQNGPDGRDIFGRRYLRDGTPEGAAVLLNDNVTGNQTRPRVSRSAGGDFVTVWETDTVPAFATRPPNSVSVGSSAGSGSGIVSRGFNPAGEAQTDDVVVAESDSTSNPSTPDVDVDDKGKATVTFERRKNNNDSDGIFRREVLLPKPPSTCTQNNRTLCLNGGRFKVRAEWEKADGSSRGVGKAVSLTGDTGYFYFFNPENVEVVVKTLDACTLANSYWVFAGGLTDVEVTLVVEDTATGQAISYFNPAGPYQPIRDTSAFATCGAATSVHPDPDQITRMSDAVRAELEALAAADLDELGRTREQAGAGNCFSTSTRLCLNGGRFSVEVQFDTQTDSGPALRSTLTDETGYFSFFDPSNVEVVIKVLNACSLNNRYWVFGAGLTDVEVEVLVTDTLRGSQKVYRNATGNAFQPINDTDAFDTCP